MSTTFLSSDESISSGSYVNTGLTATLVSGKTHRITALIPIDKAGNDPGGWVRFGGTAVFDAIQCVGRFTHSHQANFQTGPFDQHVLTATRSFAFPTDDYPVQFRGMLEFTAMVRVGSSGGGSFVLQGKVDDPPTSFTIQKLAIIENEQLD